MKYEPTLVKLLVSGAFAYFNETIFITRTVKDLLWGYKDQMLEEINQLLPDLGIQTTFGLFYGVCMWVHFTYTFL